ncbi:unnamed protein product [Moneuplotes crassus]|uniref:Uncharacterized protein n=1 Tax=Euplotes crassus TaxID=5936 RepID=A0AAD1UKZ1_EUPCR|nr:unnamed protein product [Moneuplotes crassus]
MEASSQMIASENEQKAKKEKLILKKTQKIAKDLRVANYIYNYSRSYERHETYDSDEKNNATSLGLNIEVDEQRNINFVKKKLFLYQVKMEILRLRRIEGRNKNIINLFTSSFPNTVSTFGIYSIKDGGLNISPHLLGITRVISRVLEEIDIMKFKISLPQFKRMMTSFSHICQVKIRCCKLSIPRIPEFPYQLKNTRIQHICLNHSGNTEFSDWRNNRHEFINLIKGLSTSPDLVQSLEQITLKYCEVELAEARKVLSQNGFRSINLECWLP